MFEAVFCDLDGTLLRNGVVDPLDLLSLTGMREMGARLVLVTGRPSRTLGDVPRELLSLFDATYCCNGAEIYDGSRGNVISSFSDRSLSSFLRRLSLAIPALSFGFEFGSRFVFEASYRFWPSGEGESIGVWSDMFIPPGSREGICKVLCRAPDMDAARLYERVQGYAGEHELSFSCDPGDVGPIELAPPGVNKAAVVQRECARFALNPASCVAFGNANNDIAMLESVGRGVMVGARRDDGFESSRSSPSVAAWLTATFEGVQGE